MHTVGEAHRESLVTETTKVFSHTGIEFDEAKLTLQLSEEARMELGAVIREIQGGFSNHAENIEAEDGITPSDITEAVVQNVLDGMIDKKKGGGKLMRLYERIQEMRRKKKIKPKAAQNVEDKIRKYSSGEFEHVMIDYREGDSIKRIPLPLIIRPDDTVKSVLDSMTVRLRFLKIT